MHDTIESRIVDALELDQRVSVATLTVSKHESTYSISGDVYPRGIIDTLHLILPEILDYHPYSLNIKVLPDQELSGTPFTVTSLSVANIYRAPSHSSELLTQALLGTPLELLKRENQWFLVRLPDGYIGWTFKPGPLMTENEFRAWKKTEKVIVTADWGRVKKSADSHEYISDFVSGDIFECIAIHNGSYSVRYPDGRTGFLENQSAKLLRAWCVATVATGRTILETAHRFLGLPYLWGGISTKGMDCSGFVKTIFFLNGLLLPRDADQQALVGDLISDPLGAAEGDLLFFGDLKSQSTKKITHVGISMGSGRFIHESGDVHCNSLIPGDTDYSEAWQQSFICAKKVLGAQNCSGIKKVSDLFINQGHTV